MYPSGSRVRQERPRVERTPGFPLPVTAGEARGPDKAECWALDGGLLRITDSAITSFGVFTDIVYALIVARLTASVFTSFKDMGIETPLRQQNVRTVAEASGHSGSCTPARLRPGGGFSSF
jgi:hypothetical protein